MGTVIEMQIEKFGYEICEKTNVISRAMSDKRRLQTCRLYTTLSLHKQANLSLSGVLFRLSGVLVKLTEV